MKRKVIKQGPSSFMINLPKNWVRQKEISKGQELEVDIKGETILVSIGPTTPNDNIKEFVLNKFNLENIFRYYSEGVSGVNIHFKSEEEFKKIKQIVGNLIGADILDRDRSSAKILFSDFMINLDKEKLLFKILSLLKWQIQSLSQELKKKKMRNPEEIREIQIEMLSKINLLLRSIYCKKRISLEFVNYQISLEHLKNIQKAFVDFYDNFNLKNVVDYKLLESLEEILNKMIYFFSNNNSKNNILEVIEEIVDLKKFLLNIKYDSLDILNKEIITGLEAFSVSLNYFLNTGKNSATN